MAILIPSIQGAVNHGSALRKAVVQACQYAKRNAVFSGNDAAVTDLIEVFKAHKTLVETRPALDAVHLGPFQGLGWPDFRKQAYHCRAWANGEASKASLLAFWDGALAELGFEEEVPPVEEQVNLTADFSMSNGQMSIGMDVLVNGKHLSEPVSFDVSVRNDADNVRLGDGIFHDVAKDMSGKYNVTLPDVLPAGRTVAVTIGVGYKGKIHNFGFKHTFPVAQEAKNGVSA